MFIAVFCGVLGVNKLVQKSGNGAVTRRKVREITGEITTTSLLEKNKLLARIKGLSEKPISGKGTSWANTILLGACAVALSTFAVIEPHTKGKITDTVEQLEADQKAGDFVSQVATVLGQIEGAMKENDATALLVDQQSKEYLEREGKTGK